MFFLVGLLTAQGHMRGPIHQPKEKAHYEEEESSMPPAANPNVWYGSHAAAFSQPRALFPYTLKQINVDQFGMNILGDAANEPSMTVDPTNPKHIAVGWRQFDSINSNFRQAGHAYTYDGGVHWVNNGPLTPGTFRSDPVLATRADGAEFYYNSLTTVTADDMWYSNNWGNTWNGPFNAFGGDKQWIVCDTSATSPGKGNIYDLWSAFSSGSGSNTFTRSKNGGRTWETPSFVPQQPTFGVPFLGNSGDLYAAGTRNGATGLCWAHAAQPYSTGVVSWGSSGVITSTYDIDSNSLINPEGLAGQVWGAVAPTGSPYAGHVYVLTTVANFAGQPDSVVLFRSTNGGSTWSAPIRVDTNLGSSTSTYHWFGVMSVAPNGRIDVCYNDCGLDPNPTSPTTCVTMYRSSTNDGATWSTPKQLTQPWAFGVGYPQQNKIGDYSALTSDRTGAHFVFAATFNGEEDIYYMRIGGMISPTSRPVVPGN